MEDWQPRLGAFGLVRDADTLRNVYLVDSEDDHHGEGLRFTSAGILLTTL